MAPGQESRPADKDPGSAAVRAAGRAIRRPPRIAAGRNSRRTGPSTGLVDSSRSFGRGAVVHRLVAVDFDHGFGRGFLDVLRHQTDVVGRRALVAIAIDWRAVEQAADRFDVFL